MLAQVRRRAVGVLIGCLILAGCAEARPAGPGLTATPVMIDLATRSGRWTADAERLQRAVDALDRACLRGAGLSPPAAPRVRLPVPEDEAAVIGMAERRRVGYGIVDAVTAGTRSPEAEPEHSTTALSQEEQRRYTEAQFGLGTPKTSVPLLGEAKAYVPAAGCIAQSRRKLAGDVDAWARLDYLPQQFDDRVTNGAEREPVYTSALAAWRSCMERSGRHHADPDAARASVRDAARRPGDAADLKRKEVELAVADGLCAARSHLPTALLQARRARVAHLPQHDLAVLRALSEEWLTTVARARSTR
ncbi:hypothetical protein [Streptomyces roseolus]|uniref:hypothetical protein n=1 Tax=Streptomyces roseolus TaxID=67358 RepID=UPI00167A49F4|nr:hypothetical protein [Streptomyces roseolus]GGR66468.1 hypothetical protein GCM10010282_69340 [Streptomyces roseolus]